LTAAIIGRRVEKAMISHSKREVYRFERIDEGVGSICRRLNVELGSRAVDTWGQRTSTCDCDYRTKESRCRVADHFRGEIEQFDHSFG
jgi:hypothetical protein